MILQPVKDQPLEIQAQARIPRAGPEGGGREPAGRRTSGAMARVRRPRRAVMLYRGGIPMKLLVTCSVLLAAATAAFAQSPAATETRTYAGKTITIKYSSPRVNGRVGKLFGKDGQIGTDPTYPVWRAGANAATSFHTDADLDLAGLAVPKGDYTLYVDLTDQNNWVLVVNKQTGQSGLIYNKAQDLGRAKMTMSKPPAPIENLKYTLTDEGGGKGSLQLEWENHIASVALTVK
jgi:hypothetical protein